jgi:hypothetical protein
MISLKSIRDSKPYLMPHTPDLEAKRISDTGAQQYVAGKDSITRAIRAARRESVASGTTYTDPAMVGKEMQASNELAARIEATRNNIEATNVQMENNIAAQNRQVRTSVDAQNANIINSFEQMKTNATSSVIGNMSTNISNNVSGIAQVIMQKNMRMEQERLSLLESIKDMKQKVLDYSASNNPGAQATASSYVDRMVEQYKKRYDSEPSLLF